MAAFAIGFSSGRTAPAAAGSAMRRTGWEGRAVVGPGLGVGPGVVTGGEPMLQLDAPLIDALHGRGFRVAVESNGTLPAVAGIDWLCISPKAGTDVVQRSGDELKLVWPQGGIDPAELESWDFRH